MHIAVVANKSMLFLFLIPLLLIHHPPRRRLMNLAVLAIWCPLQGAVGEEEGFALAGDDLITAGAVLALEHGEGFL